MGGLAVIFFIAFYILVAVTLIGRCKSSGDKWFVIAVLVLIPSGDAVVGRLYLKHLCAEEGGLKVYRVAEHVEGFMDDGSHSNYWVKERGYQFAENRLSNEMTTRYSKQNEQIIREDKVLPQSQYRVRLQHMGSVQDRYLRNMYLVENIPNGEILAKDTQIAFNGGWAERFLVQFSDAGGGSVAWCSNTELDPFARHERLVTTILKR